MKLIKALFNKHTYGFWILLSILLLLLFYISNPKIAHSELPAPFTGVLLLERAFNSSLFAQNSLLTRDYTKDEIVALIEEKANLSGLNPKIMLRLAKCESGYTQFNKDGTVLRGRVHPFDIGIFQINQKVWGDAAKMTGYDPYEVEGNIDLAMVIALTGGYKQWVCYK